MLHVENILKYYLIVTKTVSKTVHTLRDDMGGDDGLLVHNGLHNLGDVWGWDGLVNWHGVWLVDGHRVGLVNWDWLSDWDGLWHTDQLDSLDWDGREVTTVTEAVAAKTSWGSVRKGEWGSAVAEADGTWTTVAAELTTGTDGTSTVADWASAIAEAGMAEQGWVGNSHSDEGSDNEEFHVLAGVCDVWNEMIRSHCERTVK